MNAHALGRFNHHPIPAVDYCCEIDALEGMEQDVTFGLETHQTYRQRLTRALDFNVGGDEHAVAARRKLIALAQREEH